MVVELRNGKRFMVVVGDFETYNNGNYEIIFVGVNGFAVAGDYDNDLKSNIFDDSEFDVVKVFRPKAREFAYMIHDKNATLLWERGQNVKKKPTLRDIEIMRAIHLLYGSLFFACEKNGMMFGYDQKPVKNEETWVLPTIERFPIMIPNDRALSHISWEDEEPYEFNPDM